MLALVAWIQRLLPAYRLVLVEVGRQLSGATGEHFVSIHGPFKDLSCRIKMLLVAVRMQVEWWNIGGESVVGAIHEVAIAGRS